MFLYILFFFFFFQAEDGIRDRDVTGVQTCALPISTVVIEGLLYSASRVLSKPVTETSCGTRHPAFNNPLITPTAVRSLTATAAVGLGDNFAIASPAANPPSKRKSPRSIGPGSSPKSCIHFSYACNRARLDLSLGLPAMKAIRRCPLEWRYLTICSTPEK